ncbi:MAG: long-chain fatty acid--CoA ligase [Acidimicrobiales bacterium]|nr:long-chain fatty acid--CoA ligase [Acidimicrobiales bacterium]
MHVGLVLEMTHTGLGDRPAVVSDGVSLTHRQLAERAWAAAARFEAEGTPAVLYLGGNHLAFPLALFGAAAAGVPFVPINYRLAEEQIRARLEAHPGALVLHQGTPPAAVDPGRALELDAFRDSLVGVSADPTVPCDPEEPCVLLYTSGTTSAPKAAVLRHRHLMSYLLGTVEFGGAAEDEAALVTVPPYHVAGVANLLSNVFAGRRIVYLDQFDAESWLGAVRREGVSQAMVVPTMLARIVDHLADADEAGTPSLRTISYGGAPMPAGVLRRAMTVFPAVGFVNAYGLTETSSTIALLGPEDHREAFASEDPGVRDRLQSVGRLLPGVELEVRNDEGHPLPAGQVGLLFLRGEQISGEYAHGTALDEEGWFPTRDRGWVDEHGFLFIEGRADDTIIRGGENIAPAEIEEVLLACDGVADAAVVGLPDEEWGQRLAAVVVPRAGAALDAEALRAEVRGRLRSSKTPETIEFWSELPRTDTGKLLRRIVVDKLAVA